MDQTFKHAVIACNPDEDSFTLSVARRYGETVQAHAHEVVLRDLYRMNFDPVLHSREREGHPAKDVRHEWAVLGKVDVFVLVYPIWFGTTPAMLKGYIDRVFGAGRTRGWGGEGSQRELLAGKRLVSLTSSGKQRAWLAEKGVLGSLRTVYDRYFAEVFGFLETHSYHFDGVSDGINDHDVAIHLHDVEEAAREVISRMVAGPPDERSQPTLGRRLGFAHNCLAPTRRLRLIPAKGRAIYVSTRAPLSPARSWWAIFIFMIALMFNYLDRQVMTLLITPIKKDFHLSDTNIALLTGFAFVVFYVIVGIPISRLVDRGPRKWLLGGALTFWSVMTAACGLAGNVWQLTAARMLVGAGESCNAPGTYSMTSDMFRRDKLAAPMSVIGIGTVAGSGMALLVGGLLIGWLNHVGPQTFPLVGTLKPWQMTFIIVSLPGVLSALLMLATVPEPPRHAAAGATSPSFTQTVRYTWTRRGRLLPDVHGLLDQVDAKPGRDRVVAGLFRAQVRLSAGTTGVADRAHLADRLADRAGARRMVGAAHVRRRAQGRQHARRVLRLRSP